MRTLHIVPILFAATLALVGCNGGSTAAGGGSAAPGEKTYTFQLNPKEGETYTYVTKMTGAQPIEMTMPMVAAKVTDNEVVLEAKIAGMKVNGQEMPPQVASMIKDLVITSTMDKTGKAVKTEVSGVPDAMKDQFKGSGSAASIGFPTKPIKVGETWTGETDVQGKKVTMTYKLVRVEEVDGMEAAIVEASTEDKAMQLEGPMTMAIELATGMMINMKANMAANGQKTSMEMTRQ